MSVGGRRARYFFLRRAPSPPAGAFLSAGAGRLRARGRGQHSRDSGWRRRGRGGRRLLRLGDLLEAGQALLEVLADHLVHRLDHAQRLADEVVLAVHRPRHLGAWSGSRPVSVNDTSDVRLERLDELQLLARPFARARVDDRHLALADFLVPLPRVGRADAGVVADRVRFIAGILLLPGRPFLPDRQVVDLREDRGRGCIDRRRAFDVIRVGPRGDIGRRAAQQQHQNQQDLGHGDPPPLERLREYRQSQARPQTSPPISATKTRISQHSRIAAVRMLTSRCAAAAACVSLPFPSERPPMLFPSATVVAAMVLTSTVGTSPIATRPPRPPRAARRDLPSRR